MSRRLYIEQPAPARLRAWCWALLLAPFAICLAAEAAAALLSPAPYGSGGFVPTPEVMVLGILGAALYASVFTFLLRRLRGYLAEDFFLRTRGRSTGRQSPWVMGGTLFALVAIMTPPGAVRRDQSGDWPGHVRVVVRPGQGARPGEPRLRVPGLGGEPHDGRFHACVRAARALGTAPGGRLVDDHGHLQRPGFADRCST